MGLLDFNDGAERRTQAMYRSLQVPFRFLPHVVLFNIGSLIRHLPLLPGLAIGTPIEVTQTILKENRSEPALREVFLHVARRQSNEAA